MSQQVEHSTNQQQSQNRFSYQTFVGKLKSIFGSPSTGKVPSDIAKEQYKKQFVNEQPRDWPNWKKTDIISQRTPEETKEQATMKNICKIPKGLFVCRSHCLYYEYYVSDDGFTYFYMKNSNDYLGYKQILEPYKDNTACYRNFPILKMKSEIALKELEEKVRKGQYEVYKQYSYTMPYRKSNDQ